MGRALVSVFMRARDRGECGVLRLWCLNLVVSRVAQYINQFAKISRELEPRAHRRSRRARNQLMKRARRNEVKELKASATAPRVPVMSALPDYVPDAPEPLAMAVLQATSSMSNMIAPAKLPPPAGKTNYDV